MTPDGERRITLSERRLGEILDLRFAQFEQRISEHFVSDSRAREIVRDEMGIVARTRWDLRSKMAAVAMLFLSVSTFLMTFVLGRHGG